MANGFKQQKHLRNRKIEFQIVFENWRGKVMKGNELKLDQNI